MSHETTEGSPEPMVYRRDPESLVWRSYLLSLTEFEKLAAEGLDPETVSEAELYRRSKEWREFDALGRLVTMVSMQSQAQVRIYPVDGAKTRAN